MNVAAQRLKGHRNHRSLTDLFDAEGNVVEKGARTTAQELMEQYEVPVFVQRQNAKSITTSDGRERTTFDGYYLAFSETDNTIESVKPDGWTDEEPESTGKLAREQREEMALAAKVALADLMESLLVEDEEETNAKIRTTFAAWAKRIPGDATDVRLTPNS